MARSRNTDIAGKPFGQTTVGAVWRKGAVVQSSDADTWRKDTCGRLIKFQDYGNINSKHGWEVDHIKPVARDGNDELSNLQPLLWELNRDKGDTYPWSCPR